MAEALLSSRFAGCMLGCAVGDALGTFAFHRLPGRLVKLEDGDTLRYTDDTAMVIGVAETLALRGRLDEKLLGDRFLANWRREPDRGYASGPVKVFDLVAGKGVFCSKAAQMLYGRQGSFGNGGATAGSIAGAFHGEGEIPGGWLERLENCDHLRKLGLLICHAKSAHAREGATG